MRQSGAQCVMDLFGLSPDKSVSGNWDWSFAIMQLGLGPLSPRPRTLQKSISGVAPRHQVLIHAVEAEDCFFRSSYKTVSCSFCSEKHAGNIPDFRQQSRSWLKYDPFLQVATKRYLSGSQRK
jgi:hypothetical protein